MDLAMLIVSVFATLAAMVGAVVAVHQARAASRSEQQAVSARDEARVARDESVRLAAEANAAFLRQAVAQERANELKENELRKPDWSGPRHINGDLFAMTNSSGKAIQVEGFEVEPDGTERLVMVDGVEDGLYNAGDSFDFAAMTRLSLRPRKLVILWRFAGEATAEPRRFVIPL